MTLRFTRAASRQIDDILASINGRSPQGAANVKARLMEALDLLTIHPAMGRITERPRVRRLVWRPFPYFIFYRVDADGVVVLGFRHAARRPL